MKKLNFLKSVIVLLVIVALAFPFSASAAIENPENYGTFEEGIIPQGSYYTTKHQPIFEAFPNLDFELGLQYWTTSNGKAPKQVVDLITEGDNTYVQIKPNPESEYSGIETVLYIEDRVNLDDKLVTIYDWRGPEKENIQVYINQHALGTNGWRLTGSGRGTKLIKAAEGPNGWNTSIGLNKDIIHPTDSQSFLYVGVQAFQDKNCTTQIDNVRLGKWDPETGDIKDLDGNFVANIGVSKKEEASKPSTDKDDTAKDDTDAKKDSPKPQKQTDEGLLDTVVIILASVAGIAVVAVVVVAIILFGKKKK